MTGAITRRTIINRAGISAFASAYAPMSVQWNNAAANTPVRVGFVGIGRRGTGLLHTLLTMPGVEIRALCDINKENLARAQERVVQAGQPKPPGYSRGPEDFKRMCDRDDLDAVITATWWEWHAPVMIAAMESGKYGATEVNAGITMEECWKLVDTSEATGIPCMMLENSCYGRDCR